MNLDTPADRSLRMWPGVLAAFLIVFARFVLPDWVEGALAASVITSVLAGVAVLLWWGLLSRAPWRERLGGVVAAVVLLLACSRALHPSIAGGMMGMMYPLYAIPTLGVGLVLSAIVGSRRTAAWRWAGMLATILVATGVWTLLRTDGITGSAAAQLRWRWTPTAEERLLTTTSSFEALDRPSRPSG